MLEQKCKQSVWMHTTVVQSGQAGWMVHIPQWRMVKFTGKSALVIVPLYIDIIKWIKHVCSEKKKLWVLPIGVAPSLVISLKKGVIWWMTQVKRKAISERSQWDSTNLPFSSVLGTTLCYLVQLNKSLVKDILHNARIVMSKCDN